jgi:ribose transport system substrate-binding protein
MRRQGLLVVLAVVMLLSVSIVGCAKQTAAPAVIRDLPPEFDWLEGLAIKDDGTPLRVHYLANFMFADWPVVNANLTKSLIERGGGTCQIHDSNMDTAVELATVESLVSRGEVDVIISHASDTQGIVTATNVALDAGIPWFAVDIINNEPKITGYVGVRGQQELGRPAAEAMLEHFGGKPFVCLLMVGKLGLGLAEARQQGVESALASHPEVTVYYSSPTNVDIERYYEETINGLQAHPDIDAIIYYQSGMEGIFRGLEQMGRLIPRGQPGHIAVFGVDGSPSELEAMRDGYLDGVTEHHGGLVGELAVKLVLANVILKQDTPHEVTFLPEKITPETVDNPANFGNLPRYDWDDWPLLDPEQKWFPNPHR